MLIMEKQGFCPFRIEKRNFQAGCVLQMGVETLCYTQDIYALISRDSEYYCPLLKINISKATYSEIEEIVKPILMIQDIENTSINLWPLLTGVASPQHLAKTEKGKKMQNLSERVRSELEDIILELT